MSLLKNVGKAIASLSTASGTSATGSAAASSTARQAKVVLLFSQQRGILVSDMILGGGDRALAFATGVQGVVVETLRQQDGVGETEIDGESDDGGHEISPECAGKVGDVAGHPYQQEGDGDAVCRGLAVVLNQLRHLTRMSQSQVYATEATKGFFTSKKIQQASEMLPAMPEKASWTVKDCSNIVARRSQLAKRGWWLSVLRWNCSSHWVCGMDADLCVKGPCLTLIFLIAV